MSAPRIIRLAWRLIALAVLIGCQAAPAPERVPTAPRSVAPAGWSAAVPENSTVLVTDRGHVYVWGRDLAQPPLERRIPGDVRVRSVVRAPWGRGILVLFDEWRIEDPDLGKRPVLPIVAVWSILRDVSQTLDWSSKVVWMDPWTTEQRTLFDSRADRWGGARMIARAAEQSAEKRAGMADNDLTDLFCDAQGRLFFRTEEGLTYRMDLSGPTVRGVALTQTAPSGEGRASTERIGGIEGLALHVTSEEPRGEAPVNPR